MHRVIPIIGSLAVIATLIYALFMTGRDEEIKCLGCGEVYLMSSSDADADELFHNHECEKAWIASHPSEEFDSAARASGSK
jgi:hypothetical protein